MKSISTLAIACGALVVGLSVGSTTPLWRSTPVQAAEAAGEDGGKKLITKPLWVIFATDTAESRKAVSKECWDAHLAHGLKEEASGIRVIGGGLSDINGKREFGLLVIRADNAAEAQRLANLDPAVGCKERTVTVHQWQVNSGRMNYSINFSDSSVTFQ